MANEGMTGSGVSIRGKVALVAVSGIGIGVDLARGLMDLGAKVVLVSDVAESPAAVDTVVTDFGSREAVAQAFVRAAERIGPVDLMVHGAIPKAALVPRTIDALSVLDWDTLCLKALKTSLYCLQAGYRQMAGRGGAMVLVGANVSLIGAAGLVALSTVLEGQRALAKSAARQWGRHGIRVNWVGPAATKLDAALAETHLPQVPELGPPPPPLGRAPELRDEIAPVIAFLAGPAGRMITGATLCMDGGEWMVP